jgi:hypothetical protein
MLCRVMFQKTWRKPMKRKGRNGRNPSLVLADDQDINEAINEAIQEAVRRGWIVDTGKRRWSERTGRYEIVWKSLLAR